QACRLPADGEYLVAVRDHLNQGSPIHAYRIEISAPSPALSLGIAELQRYVAQTLEVPRGGRTAVMLTVQRKNFSSDLALTLEGAPAGVSMGNPNIVAAQGQIPLMIRAAADAPVDAALVDIKAQTTGNDLNITGHLDQRTMLVRGQNNADMWGHNADRASIAVCDESPFDIEVVQPKVPLVRNGASALIVKAKRKADFKEAIRLRVLYTPPGVSASGSVQVPADKDEVEIPITANGNAAIGSFPITVLARYRSGKGGDMSIASEFINLEITDSFFDFKFNKSVAEIGKPTTVGVGLTIKRPPEGDALIELVGLPAGVKLPEGAIKITPEMTALNFPIEVAADAKPGQFKTLVCKAIITRPDGSIVQNQGTGEMQLDPPPPVPAAVAAAPVAPKPTAPPAAKPLTRLEQLRQAKAAAAAQPAPGGSN
ncbi:MAG: serine protease, partial [Pirellulaceae bacterium]|nr:serine protease [Pirellulaceae bacterium]